jgi:hypothetical protein
MFELGQIRMLPNCVKEVSGSTGNIVTLDQQLAAGNINTTNGLDFSANTLLIGANWSSQNVLALSENTDAEWIACKLKVTSASVNLLSLGIMQIGFGNENWDINTSISEYATVGGYAQGDGGTGDDETNFQIVSDNAGTGITNNQYVAQTDDNTGAGLNITDIEIIAALKRDGSDFWFGAKMNSDNDSCGGYVLKSLANWVDFNEAYPFVLISDFLGGGIDIDYSFQYGFADLDFTKPNAQSLVGNGLNNKPTVACPLPQTGQRLSYTPIGRISKDDGIERAGRLNKTSAYENNVATANQGTVFSGYLSQGQYSVTSQISFGNQIIFNSNYVTIVPKLGLMYQFQNQVGANLAWDDTAGNNNDIFAFCDGANAANFGAGLSGHNDWRVANIFEIMNVMFYNSFNGGTKLFYPDFNPTEIPTQWNAGILSSTTYLGNTSECLALTPEGLVTNILKTTVSNQHGCILVRDLTVDVQL